MVEKYYLAGREFLPIFDLRNSKGSTTEEIVKRFDDGGNRGSTSEVVGKYDLAERKFLLMQKLNLSTISTPSDFCAESRNPKRSTTKDQQIMSKYYNAQRTKGLFDPNSKEAFRLSRTKLDLFISCARCFYLDQRLGVGRPPGFPFTLNVAVDELLKREFDVHRAAGTRHPFMETYGISAVPFNHPDMEVWRDSLRRGIEYLHPASNLSLRGGVDDVWVNAEGELIVVDYKATAKRDEITLDGDLGAQYKRQMEVYQWLFSMNGHKVSKIGYFVYVNGDKDAPAFDKKLEFDVVLLPCEGDTNWIEGALLAAGACLRDEVLPQKNTECDYCAYRESAANALARQKKRTTM